MNAITKPFNINDYAHRKVRYILREEHNNADLVHTIRDHYFGHERLVTLADCEEFIVDVETCDLTVGEFMKETWR